jgi:hypothetical protein
MQIAQSLVCLACPGGLLQVVRAMPAKALIIYYV